MEERGGWIGEGLVGLGGGGKGCSTCKYKEGFVGGVRGEPRGLWLGGGVKPSG